MWTEPGSVVWVDDLLVTDAVQITAVTVNFDAATGALEHVTKAIIAAHGIGIAMVLTGCTGSTTTNPDSGLSALQGDVAAVRSAASTPDHAGTTRALTQLRTDVDRLHKHNQLSTARAASILTAATEIENSLNTTPAPTPTSIPATSPTLTGSAPSTEVPTAAPTTSAVNPNTPRPAPAAPPPEQKNDHGHGPGKNGD